MQREAERIVTIMSAFARLLLGVGDSLRVVDVAEMPAPDRRRDRRSSRRRARSSPPAGTPNEPP